MDAAAENEAELHAFRQEWRDELSARNRPSGACSPPPRPGRQRAADFHEEAAPQASHHQPDRDEQRRRGGVGRRSDRASALDHYERAVEKEAQGQLGASLQHYRHAFKLDDGVHESYGRKHFPPSASNTNRLPPSASITNHSPPSVSHQPRATGGHASSASAAVPPADHDALRAGEAFAASLKRLVHDVSRLPIEPPEPPSDRSPPPTCPIAALPEEILADVLAEVAATDVAQLATLALVCRRLAYLVLTEQAIWRRAAMHSPYGFPAMHYDYAADVHGFPAPAPANDQVAPCLGPVDDEASAPAPPLPATPHDKALAYAALTDDLLHSHYRSSWRHMFRSRPRIRFNGCYISTVNYTRAGANSTNTLTWGAPVHVVTYFRYLRFFRDGSCVSLLTTAEPADVVHYLTRHHLRQRHPQGSTLPQAVMRDALPGRWRLSGPHSSVADPDTGDAEREGDVHVETEGVVPKYTYKMHLALAHAGKATRNNKLAWKGFWSHNKLTHDWATFALRNDKPFYWSRVKSYGLGD